MISLGLYALYLGIFEDREAPKLVQNLKSYKNAASYQGLGKKSDPTTATAEVKP